MTDDLSIPPVDDALAAPALRVLFARHDARAASPLTTFLESRGVAVDVEPHGERALAAFVGDPADAVVLAVPDAAALDLLARLRARSDVPIVTVGAPDDLDACVGALEGGADDHVAPGVDPGELLARLHAHVRRARGVLAPPPPRLEVGPLVVDLDARTVSLAGVRVAVTPSEYAVVRALAVRAGRVASRRHLLVALHGSEELAFDRAIDVLISRLRGKLEDDPRRPRLLKTVRGRGYVLAPPRAA